MLNLNDSQQNIQIYEKE